MDFLLLAALVVGFIVNIVVMRILLKRIGDKITFLSSPHSEVSAPPIWPTMPIGLKSASGTTSTSVPFASPNQISEDENEVELNEQNFSSLPPDVKIAVEGGDAHTPPGFEEDKK